MRNGPFAVCLLLLGAAGASAATFSADEPAREVSVPKAPTTGQGISLLPQDLKLAVSPISPTLMAAPETPSAPAEALKTPAPLPENAPAAMASPQSRQPGPAAADEDEPTADELAQARTAVILKNPTLPARIAKIVERELGITADHPLFEHISRRGSQPRNAHTNEPIGEEYGRVNPVREIAGLFYLRQEKRAYYDSLKNPKTGVVATGMRGGVDQMVDDLLEKGRIPPRSQGRNYRFQNGVYMDLPSNIHEARKFAAVDPYRTEGKDRYPMFVAFRAGNVHNPGSEHQGRIMGDGGTLGQVALDPVTPADIVSIYVAKDRLAQTVARLKGTALAHVQVFPMDILPQH